MVWVIQRQSIRLFAGELGVVRWGLRFGDEILPIGSRQPSVVGRRAGPGIHTEDIGSIKEIENLKAKQNVKRLSFDHLCGDTEIAFNEIPGLVQMPHQVRLCQASQVNLRPDAGRDVMKSCLVISRENY